MRSLHVTINQREYLVGCEEGEQARVGELAKRLDRRIEELTQAIGQIGDARLLVIASLMILDELEQNEQLNEGYEFADAEQLNDLDEDENSQPLESLMQENNELTTKLLLLEKKNNALTLAFEAAISRIETLASK